MKHLFGEVKMTWPKVVIFAIITGIYTGGTKLFPILANTSFQDIAISYEWWVVFAVIVVVNCQKSWEAMLKCFVFFLISQPLVYLTEVAFGALSFNMASYFYLHIWGPATLLTLPGGFIAYYCKRQDAIGATILGLGNTIELILGISYLGQAVKSFPHHLLSGIFCLAAIGVMTLCIQKERKNQGIAFLVPVVCTALIVGFCLATGRNIIA